MKNFLLTHIFIQLCSLKKKTVTRNHLSKKKKDKEEHGCWPIMYHFPELFNWTHLSNVNWTHLSNALLEVFHHFIQYLLLEIENLRKNQKPKKPLGFFKKTKPKKPWFKPLGLNHRFKPIHPALGPSKYAPGNF